LSVATSEHTEHMANIASADLPPQEPAAPGGDPAILGLPIFVVGSLALAFSLVGYVPAAAGGSWCP